MVLLAVDRCGSGLSRHRVVHVNVAGGDQFVADAHRRDIVIDALAVVSRAAAPVGALVAVRAVNVALFLYHIPVPVGGKVVRGDDEEVHLVPFAVEAAAVLLLEGLSQLGDVVREGGGVGRRGCKTFLELAHGRGFGHCVSLFVTIIKQPVVQRTPFLVVGPVCTDNRLGCGADAA